MERTFFQMIQRVEQASSGFDVDVITNELIQMGIHSVAMNREGSEVIRNLCDKAFLIGNHEAAATIFNELTSSNPLRLLPALQQKIGFNTIVLASDYCGRNDELAILLIQRSLLVPLLKTTEDDKSFASFLFQHKVSSLTLQLILFTIARNIVDLATTERSSLNICNIVSFAPIDLNHMFFGFIKDQLLEICSLREGNRIVQSLVSFSSFFSDMVVESLKGNLVLLSTTAYARFVVQCVFDSGSDASVRMVYSEIVNSDGGLQVLILDPYGHYVVKALLRRLFVLNSSLMMITASNVFERAADLENHEFGVHVLRECRSLVKIYGAMQ